MLPKVSVVTCSYNRPELLRLAVESLRAQTDQNWEHLIYDDASTNSQVERTLAWALEDPRVRVWRGRENLDRPSVLWNFMMDRARGRYLTVLDDDNEKLPSFIEAMSRELDDDPGLDVVTCGWRVDRLDDGGMDGAYFLNLSTTSERLRELSTCDGGAMLYRREVFERAGYFSEALRTNEDWDWLRRALHGGRVKNLHETHATYRVHKDTRMRRAESLGNDIDVVRVRSRLMASTIGVTAVYPPLRRLTESQRDVCSSTQRGLAEIPWVTEGRDVCLVVSPFQRSATEVAAAVRGYPRVISLHMEDPYALGTNLERVQIMAKLAETWVCTNDAATVPFYRKIVGDRVIACPSLSADATMPTDEVERTVDVLLCGYAYESRKKFVRALLPLLDGLRVMLVGDGWWELPEQENVTVLPTQSLAASYDMHRWAKTVVCVHRVGGDCSDGPVKPATVNRGFLEGYCGARVFVDRSRPQHDFDEGDVEWFSGPVDLAAALHAYLSTGAEAVSGGLHTEKCRSIYTYRTRLARILNCVRAPRFLAEVP